MNSASPTPPAPPRRSRRLLAFLAQHWLAVAAAVGFASLFFPFARALWPFYLFALVTALLWRYTHYSVPDHVAFYLVLALIALAIYSAPDAAKTAVAPFQASATSQPPFDGEMAAAELVGALNSINFEAQQSESSSPCPTPPQRVSGTDDYQRVSLTNSLPHAQLTDPSASTEVQIDGLSLQAVRTLLHPFIGTGAKIEGEIIAGPDQTFSLRALVPKTGDVFIVAGQPATSAGFHNAACQLAVAIMASTPGMINSLGAAYVNLSLPRLALALYSHHPPDTSLAPATAFELEGMAWEEEANLIGQADPQHPAPKEADLQRALADLKKAAKKAKRNSAVYTHKANVELELGYTKDANADYQLAKETAADPHLVDFWHGFALAHSGADAKAVTQFTAALNFEPNWEDAFYQRGRSYLKLKDFEHAVSDFKQALAIKPFEPSVIESLSQALTAEGKIAPGFQSLAHSLAHSLDTRGFAALRSGGYSNAAYNYRYAFQFDPSLYASEYGEGIALFKSGKNKKGTKLMQDALKNQSNLRVDFTAQGVVPPAI